MRKLLFISLIAISTLFFAGYYKDNLRAESRQALEVSLEGRVGLDVAELSHVAQTSPVITWAFTCTNNTDERDMEKIADALLRISELDSQKREIFPVDIRYGFVKVEDSDFDDLRKMGR